MKEPIKLQFLLSLFLVFFISGCEKHSVTSAPDIDYWTFSSADSLFRQDLEIVERIFSSNGQHLPLDLDHIIKINSNGRITHLNLDDRDLTYLPGDIEKLSALQHLVLSNNNIYVLPKEMAALHQMRRLYVGNNNLSRIDFNLSRWQKLEVFSADYNAIGILPMSLFELQNLRELNVMYNDISELPSSISKLTHLRKLNLRNNNLRELPDALAQLSELTYLDVAYNHLYCENGEQNRELIPDFLKNSAIETLNGLFTQSCE